MPRRALRASRVAQRPHPPGGPGGRAVAQRATSHQRRRGGACGRAGSEAPSQAERPRRGRPKEPPDACAALP
eukprot:12163349-Alexandrium_andersonii.AAC.1